MASRWLLGVANLPSLMDSLSFRDQRYDCLDSNVINEDLFIYFLGWVVTIVVFLRAYRILLVSDFLYHELIVGNGRSLLVT